MSADLYVSLSPLYVRPRASPGRCGRLYGRVVKSIWVGVTNGTPSQRDGRSLGLACESESRDASQA